MDSPLPLAALAATLDFSRPRRLAVAASFFTRYPRFSSYHHFSRLVPYRHSLYRLSIPYALITAVLLILIATLTLYFRRSPAPIPSIPSSATLSSVPKPLPEPSEFPFDEPSHPPRTRLLSSTAVLYLPFSAFLTFCLLFCISVLVSKIFVLRHAVNDIRNTVDAMQFSISRLFLLPVHTLLRLSDTSAPRSSSPSSPSSNTLLSLLRTYHPSFASASRHIVQLLANLRQIDARFAQLVTFFFYFTIAVAVAILLALLCTLLSEILPPRSRFMRTLSAVALLLPFLATWAYAAVATILSAATADFCVSLQDYRESMRTQIKGTYGHIEPSNVFKQYGLVCPTRSASAEHLRRTRTFLRDSESISNFAQALRRLSGVNVGDESWLTAREWMKESIDEYKQCKKQLHFAGQLLYHTCDNQPVSVISGMAQLWVGACGAALLLSLVVALRAMRHPVCEFASSQDLLQLHGAPQVVGAVASAPKEWNSSVQGDDDLVSLSSGETVSRQNSLESA